MKIIGIGGLSRSGKDTLAEYLIERGYFGVSFGDIIRGYARKRHSSEPDPISVANMTETANWLRRNHGADFVLQEALAKFKDSAESNNYTGLALYSVRAPVEVDFIHKNGGVVVWVDAPARTRYERSKASRREGESDISFKEFQSQEAQQWQPQPDIPAEAQMNAKYVKENSDISIKNDSNELDAFNRKVQKALSNYL